MVLLYLVGLLFLLLVASRYHRFNSDRLLLVVGDGPDRYMARSLPLRNRAARDRLPSVRGGFLDCLQTWGSDPQVTVLCSAFSPDRCYRRLRCLWSCVLAFLLANITVSSWAVVRYFGGLRLPGHRGRICGSHLSPFAAFLFLQSAVLPNAAAHRARGRGVFANHLWTRFECWRI